VCRSQRRLDNVHGQERIAVTSQHAGQLADGATNLEARTKMLAAETRNRRTILCTFIFARTKLPGIETGVVKALEVMGIS
jgi:hypothetical protein